RDRACVPREPLPADLGRHLRRPARADRRHDSRRGRRDRALIPVSRHRIMNLVADAVLIAAAWTLAFWLRFDHGVPPRYRDLMLLMLAPVVAIKLVVFVFSGFYNRWWRYVSTQDMWGAARGVVIASVISDLVVYLVHPVKGFPLPK